jgi:hypothetical protein
VTIKGQRARNKPGSLNSDRCLDGARYGNGGLTQRYARMQYVVTGREPARIEGGPGHGPGNFINPDLDANMLLALNTWRLTTSMPTTERLAKKELRPD